MSNGLLSESYSEEDTELQGEGRTADNEEEWTSEPSSSLSGPHPHLVAPKRIILRVKALLSKKLEVGVAGAEGGSEEYRVYSWRWLMLVTLSLLNVSNGMMWLTFAPIPNYTAVYYGIDVEQVDWFSISYFVVSLVIGFVAIGILDVFGLRVSLYLGAGFNITGSILRWLSTSRGILCSPHYRLSGFMVALMGQILTACAQPFLLYAPTKLASFWFGPKERAFCTMLASLGNPVGLALAQIISPNVVTGLDKFSTLHAVYTIPAAMGALLTFIAFWRSKPPVPPAPSAYRDPIPLFRGLKQVVTTPPFLLLLGVWGCSSGLFNALLTLLAQILCPFGYSDSQSGLWGALMIFCGLIGATCAGFIIDYFKIFKEVAVVSFSLAILSMIWFVEVFSLSGQSITIAFSVCAFGFFGLPLIPACMELGVEITYPVSEATSSGLLWSATQIMGIVLVLLGQVLQTDISGGDRVRDECSIKEVPNSTTLQCTLYNSTSSGLEKEVLPRDLTNALLFYLVVGFLALVTFAFLFKPKYKRLDMESRAEVLTRLQASQVVTPSSSVTSLPSSGRDSTGNIDFKMASDQRQTHQTSTEF